MAHIGRDSLPVGIQELLRAPDLFCRNGLGPDPVGTYSIASHFKTAEDLTAVGGAVKSPER